MAEFSFEIRGPLLGWMRPAGKVGRYDPPEQKAYKNMVAMLCKLAMRKARIFSPLEGPISLGFVAFYPTKLERPEWKDTKPDLDNLIKNIKDAVNEVAWIDDRQVAHYTESGKFWMPSISGEYAMVRIANAAADFSFALRP